jgi:hypothetical protein
MMNVQLKAFLIGIAAFTIVDAAVWQGQYRAAAITRASMTAHWMLDQNWG